MEKSIRHGLGDAFNGLSSSVRNCSKTFFLVLNMSVTSFGGCNSPYKYITKTFSVGQRIWKNRSSIVWRCLQRVIMIRAHLFQNFLVGHKYVSDEFWGLQFSLQVYYQGLFCWPADMGESIKHCWEMLSSGFHGCSACIGAFCLFGHFRQWQVGKMRFFNIDPGYLASSPLDRTHQGGSESLLYCWVGHVLAYFQLLQMDSPCSYRLIGSECSRGPIFSVDSSIRHDAVVVVVASDLILWEIPLSMQFWGRFGSVCFSPLRGQWEPWLRHTSLVWRTFRTSQETKRFIWAYNKAVFTGLFWLWRINSKTFYLVLIMSAIQWGHDWPYQNCSKAFSDLVGKQMARSSIVRRHRQRVFKVVAGLSRMNLCIFFLFSGKWGAAIRHTSFQTRTFQMSLDGRWVDPASFWVINNGCSWS